MAVAPPGDDRICLSVGVINPLAAELTDDPGSGFRGLGDALLEFHEQDQQTDDEDVDESHAFDDLVQSPANIGM